MGVGANLPFSSPLMGEIAAALWLIRGINLRLRWWG